MISKVTSKSSELLSQRLIALHRFLSLFLVLFMVVTAAVPTSQADSIGVGGSAPISSVPLKLTDQENRPFLFSDLRGRPIVVAMAYTGCRSACPLTMQRLLKIESGLEKANVKAEFVVASLDPEFDTPEQLKKFGRSYKLNKPYWHFVTGAKDQIRKLSLLLGVSFQKSPETAEVMHSNKIVLLDRNGDIALEVEGLNAELDPLLRMAINIGKQSE